MSKKAIRVFGREFKLKVVRRMLAGENVSALAREIDVINSGGGKETVTPPLRRFPRLRSIRARFGDCFHAGCAVAADVAVVDVGAVGTAFALRQAHRGDAQILSR